MIAKPRRTRRLLFSHCFSLLFVAAISGFASLGRNPNFPLQLLQSPVHLQELLPLILTNCLAFGLAISDRIVEFDVLWIVFFAEVLGFLNALLVGDGVRDGAR